MEHRITCLFVIVDYCMITSAPVARIFKGHWSRPTPLSYGSKQLRCYDEMVLGAIVRRKVSCTHTEGNNKYFTVKYLRSHAQTRKWGGGGDRWGEKRERDNKWGRRKNTQVEREILYGWVGERERGTNKQVNCSGICYAYVIRTRSGFV